MLVAAECHRSVDYASLLSFASSAIVRSDDPACFFDRLSAYSFSHPNHSAFERDDLCIVSADMSCCCSSSLSREPVLAMPYKIQCLGRKHDAAVRFVCLAHHSAHAL